jgi:hypothetical protein
MSIGDSNPSMFVEREIDDNPSQVREGLVNLRQCLLL